MIKEKETNKNRIIFAALINLLFLAFCRLVYGINYEMLDEMIFSELAADGYYYGNFSNYFLLALIGAIQRVINPVNAYVVFSLVAAIAAMITVSYIFFSKFNLLTASVITILFNGCVAINHYSTISFTRLPALLCAAGLLLIFHTFKEKNKPYGLIWGSILVLIGSMFRFKIFIVSFVVLVVFIASYAFSDALSYSSVKTVAKNTVKSIFEPKRILCLLMLCAVCFSFYFVSVKINNSTEELRYFQSYTALRSQVWDYEIPSYEECSEEYDRIGIDENDLIMLRGHFLDDNGAFTREKLSQIKEIRDNYYSNVNLKSVIREIYHTEKDNFKEDILKANLYYAVISLVVFFIIAMKKENYIIALSLLFASFVFYVYLYFDGRVPYRVIYGIWLPVILYLIYSFDKEKIKPIILKLCNKVKKPVKTVFAVLLVLSSIAVSYRVMIVNDYENFKNDYSYLREIRTGINEYVKAHPDDRFELVRTANLFEGNIDYETIDFVNNDGRNKNSHIFNGTYYRLPYYDEFNKDVFGTDNMFSNLLNENVYFVDRNNGYTEPMRLYLEKYYSDGKTVSYDVVDNVDDYNVINYYYKD